MQSIRPFEKKTQLLLRTKSLLLAILILTAWLWCLPARAAPSSNQGKVLHLDVRGLNILLQADPNLLLIDVRTPGELTGPLGKIPQARSVPLQKLENNPGQFPRNKTLVLICRSGHRSLKAANLLAADGYVVYSVDGGMRAWRRLHSQASSSAGETGKKELVAPGARPNDGKSSPGKNGNQQHKENFFDNNMGC